MASRLTTFIVATIVAGTLIAGLIVGAQRDDATGPVDVIITNGRVYTAEGGTFAEAVAIRGNKILVVGSNREIKRLRRPHTTMVDAHGGTVLPGFNDAHVQIVHGGRTLTDVDLAGASTLADIEIRVKTFAAANSDEPWVRGRRWVYQPFPGVLSARQHLDVLVPDRPAFLTASDGRAGWANSRALQLAGVSRRTPNPPDGVIVKDPRTGEPTGVLKDGAMRLVERVLPPPDANELRDAVRAAAAEAHSVGITSIQHVAGTADDLEAFAALRAAGELDIRVYAGLLLAPGFTEADADALDGVRARYPDDPMFKAGAVTIVLRPAETGPFAARRGPRLPAYSATELTSLVRMLDARGWQVVIQTHDGQGVQAALDAFDQAIAANEAPGRGRRHRLEHAGELDAAAVGRVSALGIVVSHRPTQTVSDIDTWAASSPAADTSEPLVGRIHSAGGRVVFASAWPLAVLDPLAGLQAAIAAAAPVEATSNEDGGADGAALLASAIDAYTSSGAWSTFDEQRKGRLERDMLADIVILSTDIFRPGTRLRDAYVHTTIFDGRVAYRRPMVETTD
jgi:predicted amidohydrolase YtcJ